MYYLDKDGLEKDLIKIADFVKNKRLVENKSIFGLDRFVGLSKNALWKIEKLNEIPKLKSIYLIAKYLNIEPEVLVMKYIQAIDKNMYYEEGEM